MRRGLWLAVLGIAAAALSACGSAALGPASTTVDAGPAASPSGPAYDGGMVVGRAYPYSLYVHCGVLGTQVDGRAFYPDSPTGFRSTQFADAGRGPSSSGTMTLVSHGVAVFREDSSGSSFRFLDHVPVVAGRGYRVDVAVAGPGRLDSIFFDAGLFLPGAVTSGRLQLPAGADTVSGTMTLDDDDNAHLSVAGAVVAYSRLTSSYACA